MKRRLATVLLISLWGGPATFGAGVSWPGKISDSRCRGKSHKEEGPPTGGQQMNDAECVGFCAAAGATFVFVTNSAVYAIDNQHFEDIHSNFGRTVQLDGELKGNTITVSKISPISKTAKE